MKLPPRPMLEEIAHAAERGEFTRIEKILDGLDAEDGAYNAFCGRLREDASRYDDEAISRFVGMEVENE